jgi:hypothetical protein
MGHSQSVNDIIKPEVMNDMLSKWIESAWKPLEMLSTGMSNW